MSKGRPLAWALPSLYVIEVTNGYRISRSIVFVSVGEGTVRKGLIYLVAVCVVSLSALAGAVRQTPQAGTPAPSVDEVLKSMRADMQGTRADIIAKNLTLTAEQAAKFWPVFEKYQKEQNVIMDEQLKGIQKYVDTYQTLDDLAPWH